MKKHVMLIKQSWGGYITIKQSTIKLPSGEVVKVFITKIYYKEKNCIY